MTVLNGEVWAWIAGAFVIGILTGVAVDDAVDMLASEWRRRRRPGAGEDDGMTWTVDRRQVLVWALSVVLVVNTLLGALLIVQRAATNDAAERAADAQERAAVTSDRLVSLTACIATYQRDFGDAYEARAKAAEDASRVLDRVVFAVAEDDAAAFRDALNDYVRTRRAQEQQRAENPLPETTLCGVPAQ